MKHKAGATRKKQSPLSIEQAVIGYARDLAQGRGPLLPPDETWDRRVTDLIAARDLEAFDAYTDEEIDRLGGFGGHEIRCWIAAFAALRSQGGYASQLDYYRIIPEWITGMGIMSGETGQTPA
mgnify:CR=1 FL=1